MNFKPGDIVRYTGNNEKYKGVVGEIAELYMWKVVPAKGHSEWPPDGPKKEWLGISEDALELVEAAPEPPIEI